MANLITIEREQHSASIWLKREDALNALNLELIEELRRAIKDLSDDNLSSPLRFLLLRSSTEKAFVAGADIKTMLSADRATIGNLISAGQSLMNQIEAVPFPVIAAIRGAALGGGLELALACDVIIASTKSKIGLPEVGLGLIPGFGGTQRLIQRVGIGRAKRLILSGEIVDGEEAFKLGVVDLLANDQEFDQILIKFTQNFLVKSPVAAREAKKLVSHLACTELKQTLDLEVESFLKIFQTKEAKEGLSAFVEKRAAKF
ncbi:MAG TPA: enoyl-CoA hydratase-related protein [Oligoflexia bacterium]|nr:enoyl-CoA hydratase-related protein [Oligoflexia bacterium]HMP27473.1 enoyl-CoA hydratase-related protein [Oligoflexia bacterium]